MIDVKELRVGNLISDDKQNVFTVKTIQSDTVNYESIHGETLYSPIALKYCEPIPLTEEWLLKFGFEKPQFNNYLQKDFNLFTVYWYPKGEGFYFHDARDLNCTIDPLLKYVHQVQNLYFALTGKEIIIKELV